MFNICGVKKRFRVREVIRTTIDGKGTHEVTQYEVCRRNLFGWKVAQIPYMHFDSRRYTDDKFHPFLVVECTILPKTCRYDDYAEAYEALVYLGYRHRYKGYTVCKAVYVEGKENPNGQTTTHEYWYVEEAKTVIDSDTRGLFYEYELHDNEPAALNYVDRKTFKSRTTSKKWL